MAQMSEEGKFKLNLAGNAAMILSIVASAFFLWTTIVQKYDEVTGELSAVNKQLQTLQMQATRVDDLSKRIEAQGQHLITDETRETTLEGKVDAMTSLLNQFIGVANQQNQPHSRK